MNNTSPFSFLASVATRFSPPAWVVDEAQQRLVLFLNHVLMQEKQAQDRLVRQKGRVVHLRWGVFAMDLIVTPAGLADRAPALSRPDLVLSVVAESPLDIVRAVLSGKMPTVKIEGDVQLAAEIGWLAENLRWDAEEDLSRLIGDAPAHAAADAGRRITAGLKQFLASRSTPPSGQAATSVPPEPTAPVSSTERRTASTPPAFQAPRSGTGAASQSVPETPVGSATQSGDIAVAPALPAEKQGDAAGAVPPVPPETAA